MNKRFIKKIEFEDGYVKKSNVLESLEAVNKDYDCETGDYGSILSEWYTCDYGEVCDSVVNLDVEDVKPVVHSHWIEYEHEWGRDYENSDYECSHCHEIISMFYDTDWCPNCGARMDEDVR